MSAYRNEGCQWARPLPHVDVDHSISSSLLRVYLSACRNEGSQWARPHRQDLPSSVPARLRQSVCERGSEACQVLDCRWRATTRQEGHSSRRARVPEHAQDADHAVCCLWSGKYDPKETGHI